MNELALTQRTIASPHSCVLTPEQLDFAQLVGLEEARSNSVVHIVIVVGDLIREIRQLRLQARLMSSYEPFTETTNRKPLLRESPLGESVWEIRFGPQNRLRVFYRSDPDDPQRVLVEVIGIKNRNRLTIGGQEVKHED